MLWLSSRDVTRSSYVAFGTKKTKGGAGAGNILSHIGVHHTTCESSKNAIKKVVVLIGSKDMVFAKSL
jgi:hypothetical protein